MTTPDELPPAKPVCFLMQDRESTSAPWSYTWPLESTSTSDAILAACNLMHERSENIRVAGIVSVQNYKSAGE